MSFYLQRRQNKYHAVKQTFEGKHYDSKKEAAKAAELTMLKNGGAIKDWEAHVKLPLYVNGVHLCDYILDFRVYNFDGSVEHIEIKSPITITPVFKIKWRLAQILYPDPNIKWVIET